MKTIIIIITVLSIALIGVEITKSICTMIEKSKERRKYNGDISSDI